MSTTTEQKPTARRLRIWDHPESRITFLETVLKDKDWEAIVYAAPTSADTTDEPAKSLEEIQKDLRKKGYQTTLGVDEEGTPALSIKHFGSERGLVTNIKDLGLTEGTARTIDHLPDTLSHTVSQVKDGAAYIAGDKARILGGFYILGDILQTFSGAFNKKEGVEEASKSLTESVKHFIDEYKNPANRLQSGAGLMALTQSLVFMFFAKDGSEMHLNRLSAQMQNALENGVAPSDVLKYEQPDGQKSHNPLNGVKSFLERHPIETGASIQIAGGMMNITGYAKRKQLEYKNDPEKLRGANFGMAGSVASIAGWLMMMYKGEHSPENIDQDSKKPNLFQRHPEAFASATEIAANGLQMMGGFSTQNPLVVASQMSFMLGDATMFFMKNNDYGAAGIAQVDMTAKAATKFITMMPMVLGQQEEQQFITDLSGYLARQMLEDQMDKMKPGGQLLNAEQNEDEISKKLAADLGRAIRKELAGKDRKLTAIVNEAANIAHQFPDADQPHVIDKLADTITGMAGVCMQREDLRNLIDAEERTLVMIDAGGGTTINNRPRMQDLAGNISTIVLALPPVNATENATKLYDALTSEIQVSKNDALYMQQALKERTAQASGLPAHIAALNATRAAAIAAPDQQTARS